MSRENQGKIAFMQDKAQAAGTRRTARAANEKTRPVADKAHEQALQHFQSAVQLMQEGKFEKARAAFEKLITNAPPELLERSKVYLAACERNAKQSELTFSTIGEQYDYAISLLNTGDYEDARDQLEGILKKNAKADYAHYGLAILDSMTGQAEECLEHLIAAIELNPQNRIQARSDSDFQDMADDPRFTELLYPETS
jgi:tetratricopeptide (TPR) repeat protein